MPEQPLSFREQAQRALDGVGGTMSSGKESDDVIGALCGIGYALLAIHDAIKPNESTEPRTATFSKVRQ